MVTLIGACGVALVHGWLTERDTKIALLGVLLFVILATMHTLRQVSSIVDDRRRAEDDLARHLVELEATVARRTVDLERANAELGHSEQKYRSIVDNIGFGIATIRTDHVVEAVNSKLLDWYPGIDLSSETRCYEALHKPPLDRPCTDCLISNVLSTGETCEAERIHEKDGEEIVLRVVASPVRSRDGSIRSVVEMAEDITERHRAHKELEAAKLAAEKASKAKDDFLAKMSHEIRTPMNGIIGMTDLALRANLSPDQHECISIANASARELLEIVDDILDIAKIEAGKLKADEKPFEFRASIAPTGVMMNARATENGLEFLARVSPEIPEHVIGDPTRLRQVLLNLVGNAIKFTSEGMVSVEFDPCKLGDGRPGVRVEVKDTGIGIAPEAMERIFGAFEQAESSISRSFGGTGLGLSISRQLVRIMGGEIGVRRRESGGTCFWFTVAAEAMADQPPYLLPAPELANRAVLVVSEHGVHRRMFADYFRVWGADVVSARTAAEGLALTRERSFELLLRDHDLPGGPELAAAVDAEIVTSPRTRTVDDMMSPEGTDTSLNLGRPVRGSVLLDAVHRLLGIEASPAPARRSGTKKAARQADLEPMQVLLVEDNIVNQKLALRVLERQGHTVALACDGREALDQLDTHSFDLVLMDVQMPVMDGLEATRVIRRLETVSGQHVPIIAMTAQALVGDREVCLNAGMDGYITKPINVGSLMTTIAEVLDQLAPTT